MNQWLDFFYVSLCGAALLLSVMGVWFIVIMPGIDRWSKRFFLTFFTVLMLVSTLTLLDMMIYLLQGSVTVLLIVEYSETLLMSMLLPLLAVYLLHCCGEDIWHSSFLRAILGFWIVFLLLMTFSQFTTSMYQFTPDLQFFRGPLYPLLIAPLSVIMLLNLAAVIRRRKKLSRKLFHSFLVATLPLTIVIPAHFFIDAFPLIDVSFVLAALSMYSIILSDQIEQDLRREREIADQRASIMVLQMRPHFIYNTMTSIYHLCELDPKKAQQVTMDFTTYLRRNLNAIASDGTIPFAEELEHTRAYLAVEEAQFEDLLFVEFNTPHTVFRLPPLTLQPIVENAVKHGMDPEAGPLHILVRTRNTDSGSEITVEDNGPGFDPVDDGSPHTTLRNIRQRLAMMCGGKLEILPREGGGTTVRVTIP